MNYLGLIVNIFGGGACNLSSSRIFALIMHFIHWGSKLNGYRCDLGIDSHLTLIMYFASYEKWV